MDIFCHGGNSSERYRSVYEINDGIHGNASLGPTPRKRILNALYGKLRTATSLKDV